MKAKENPMNIFKFIKDWPDLQPAYLWKLKFEYLSNVITPDKELFEVLSMHVKQFIEEKTIVFTEYQDFAVTRAFDALEFNEKKGFGPSNDYKVTLEFYNRGLNEATFSKIYYVKLKRRPFTLDYTNNETMTVTVDMIPTLATH